MAGKLFQDLFQGQMDFIFFFKGLAFLLVLAVACLFRKDTSQRLPWRWFGLFALAQGIAAWLSLIALYFGKSLPLITIGTGLEIISWVLLAEFGRSGLSRLVGRDSGLWLIALLLMLTGLGGLKGWSGIEQTSRYTLGLTGGLWAAVALFLAGRHLPTREQGGSLTASLCLGLFSLSVALFPPGSPASSGSFLNQALFLQYTGIPLEFCQGLLAFGMAAGIYGLLPWRHRAEESQENRRRSRFMFALLTTLAVILGLGSVLTLYLGEWAHNKHEKVKAEAQEFANIVVSRLNTEFKRMEDGVTSLAETNWLPEAVQTFNKTDQRDINALLDRYRDTLDASVVYLMDRNGKTIASSNRAAPDSFVGKNYEFRPYFKQAIDGNVGRYFAVGVTSKVPGYYVSQPVKLPWRKNIVAVAVVKVTLDNITAELQAAGQKGNSLICLADPRGIVFLASQPDMIFKTLWPVAEEDRSSLRQQYGKEQYPAIFPEKITDGSKVEYQGRNYLASFAGTIHAGWSVFFFRPIELVGVYRLTGIAVACILAILALVIVGTNFYFKESSIAAADRFRAMFDATPEAIGVVDPDTLQIVEANRSLASCLGYTQKELVALKLDHLVSLKPQQIQDQLAQLIMDEETFSAQWRARKKDNSFLSLEVKGSKLMHQEKVLAMIFFREAEEVASPFLARLRQRGRSLPVQADASSASAAIRMDLSPELPQNIPANTEEKKPLDYENFDQEARKLIKKIEEAIVKVERYRKNSAKRPAEK
ncbi:MAG: cache domain-containing protein [Deltaproteobacteria bacterium]|nr:cache domain-containing protein [Deltaproteobacteria bacterium]